MRREIGALVAPKDKPKHNHPIADAAAIDPESRGTGLQFQNIFGYAGQTALSGRSVQLVILRTQANWAFIR